MSESPPWRLARGASVQADGSVQFCVWAPRLRRLEIELVDGGRRIELERDHLGLFSALAPDVAAGSDYFLVVDDGRKRPDPVSRFQPRGVHGPSRVVDPAAFAWTDSGFRGAPGQLIYELHIGTFTPEGTFDAASERLDRLVELGVDSIEIMPVAEFPGARNWGYDGVHLYAPQSSYGGPLGMKRLIDACHARGLSVILDVVYNHVGPEGNYLAELGPYFSGRYRTPWGDALNFDDAECDFVRRHFVDNALYWLTEYHVDGLRLDAVHAIYDFSARHVLAELAEEFHAQAARLGKVGLLIGESDLNDTRVTRAQSQGGWELDAQWSDDFHHSLFTVVTGATHGYFADFGAMSDLAKAFSEGFVYDGRRSEFRRRRHGHSAADRPGAELCVFAQNHDQIANASHGRRLAELVSPADERLIAAVLSFAPNRVLLFQGQEWGETAPFHYFTSHGDPELARAVSEGRKSELAEFGAGDRYRDPQAEQTFSSSKLDWKRRELPRHRELFQLYRELFRLRRETAALRSLRKDLTRVWSNDDARSLVVVRDAEDGSSAMLLANFAEHEGPLAVPDPAGFRRALCTSHPAPPEEPGHELVLAARSAAIYLRER